MISVKNLVGHTRGTDELTADKLLGLKSKERPGGKTLSSRAVMRTMFCWRLRLSESVAVSSHCREEVTGVDQDLHRVSLLLVRFCLRRAELHV